MQGKQSCYLCRRTNRVPLGSVRMRRGSQMRGWGVRIGLPAARLDLNLVVRKAMFRWTETPLEPFVTAVLKYE